MLVTLSHREIVANNIETFWFITDKKLDYVAGQFIEMTLPHNNADERGQKHWFTLSSSPSEDLISITTKHSKDRVSTFKQVLFALKPGDTVVISEPMGDFVLPKDKSIPLVFVAGGIGITPMRSMIKWLSDSKESRDIKMIYSALSEEELAYKNLFSEYGINIKTSIEPIKSMDIIELAGNANNTLIYISGPEVMVETMEKELLNQNINSYNLVLDFFPGYGLNR